MRSPLVLRLVFLSSVACLRVSDNRRCVPVTRVLRPQTLTISVGLYYVYSPLVPAPTLMRH